jgi:hypothetical protein
MLNPAIVHLALACIVQVEHAPDHFVGPRGERGRYCIRAQAVKDVKTTFTHEDCHDPVVARTIAVLYITRWLSPASQRIDIGVREIAAFWNAGPTNWPHHLHSDFTDRVVALSEKKHEP